MEEILNRLNIEKLELFQNLFSHINAGICIIDLDFKITFINTIFAELLGSQPEELTGRSFKKFLSREKHDECIKRFKNLVDGEVDVIKHDHEFITDNGETVFGILETKCLFDDKNEAVAILSSFIDISQRKISEHEILLQNKNYKAISDFSYKLAAFPHGQAITGFLLEEFRKITGAVFAGFSSYIETEQAMFLEIREKSFSNNVVDILLKRIKTGIIDNRIEINPDIRKRIVSESVFCTDSFSEVTFGALSKLQGRVVSQVLGVDVYYGIALTEPQNGSLLGTILLGFKDKEKLPSIEFIRSLTSIASNVVNKRKSEKKLIDNRQLFQQVVNSSNDGIVVISRDKMLAVWNRGAEIVFSETAEDVIGERNFKPSWKMLCRDGSLCDSRESPVVRVFETGLPVNDEVVRIVNRKNESHWLKLNIQPVSDFLNKDTDQVVITFSEISEQIALEQELKTALDKEETLYRELRHRIKNTLSMIISIIELELRNGDAEINEDSLIAIKSRVETFSGLYSMFDYSHEHTDSIRMNEFLSKIIYSVYKAFKTKDYNIEFENTLDSVSLSSEEAASWGLILNELLTNAYKYAFESGGSYIIKVLFKKAEDGLILSVTNDGTELPENFSTGQSTGLGLKLINVLTRQLNGTFSCSSEDKETVFTISVKKDN